MGQTPNVFNFRTQQQHTMRRTSFRNQDTEIANAGVNQ